MLKSFTLRGENRRAPTTRRRVRPRIGCAFEVLESRQMLTAGPIGINLGNSLEYVDLMKEAYPFGQLGSTPLTENAQGWPTSDAAVLVLDWRVNEPWNGPDAGTTPPYIGGTYHLSFHGQATVSPPGWLQIFTVQDQVYNASTNTTTADVVVSPQAEPFLQLQFSNTVNPASATGAGVTDVHLIRPGYDANTTQEFTNDFLNALKPFTTIRYLSVDGANNYGATMGANGLLAPLNWAQRTLPDEASQEYPTGGSQGQSWENMIALANASNTDMWINIPGPATDDYVTQLANLIKNGDTVDGVHYAGLNPGLKVYVEYSNEVWGGIANPTAYSTEAGKEQVAAGNATLTAGGDNNPADWGPRWYLERSEQITTLFRNVLGPDPTYSVIRPVAAWQEGNLNYFQGVFPWFESLYGAPSQTFYAMATGQYYSPTDYSSVDAIINSLANVESQSVATSRSFATFANFYGLQDLSYEGGPAIGYDPNVSQADAANALAASRDPRMENIVLQQQLNWYANGGGLAMYFDGPYDFWSPQEEWAAAEPYQASNPSLSAKYRGLVDIANAAAQPVTAGTAVSATASTSLSIALDSMGNPNFNRPWSGQVNYWLLDVASAGNYNLSLTTGFNGNNILPYQPGTIQVLNSDQTILGTYQVGQSGSYSLGTVPLHAGLNTLAIRTVTGMVSSSIPNYWTHQFMPTSLTLSPPVWPAPAAGDSGFEGVTEGPFSYAYVPSGSTWTFAGNAGITGNYSAFTSGNPSAPQGTQVAFLQTVGSFSQTIGGWAAGSYQVSFLAAQRGNNGGSAEDFQVSVDGVPVGTFNPKGTSYQAYTTSSFAVAGGPHTITFQGLDSAGGDNTALIDSVTTANAAPFAADSGFESKSVGPYAFAYVPTGSAWTFAGNAGITGNYSAFTSGNPSAPQGTQVAFLQTVGSFSQTIGGWAAGSYQVSFLAAQRGNNGGSAEDFQVSVDGVPVGTFNPKGTSYQAYTTSSFAVAGGPHTITFQGLDSAGGDNTALIDSVTTANAAAPVAADSGFEAVMLTVGTYAVSPTGSAWTFANNSGLAYNGSAFTSGNPSAPQGTQVAYLQTVGSFSQTVSGWAAGSYQVSFLAAQRGNNGASAEDFQVLVDGVVVGTFQPQGTAYKGYSSAPFTVGAGPHTVTFKGLDTIGGDNTALIDDVAFGVAASAPSDATVSDSGFESAPVGGGSYAYRPSGSAWSFAGNAGVTGNGSGFTSANPSAPQGNQVAFLQTNGSFSQAVSGWAGGTYQLSFLAAQRGNNGGSAEDFQILVDGVVVGTFNPQGTGYKSYSTGSFTVAAGSHTITFKGLDSAGGDNTAFIDSVALNRTS